MRLSDLRDPDRAEAFARANLYAVPPEEVLTGPALSFLAKGALGRDSIGPVSERPKSRLQTLMSELQDLVRSALARPTGEAFVDFWLEEGGDDDGTRLGQFQMLVHAYVMERRAANQPGRSRDEVLNVFARAGQTLGGDQGEEAVRESISDSWGAKSLVVRFRAHPASDPKADRALSAEYAMNATQFSVCSFCILEAAFGEAEPTQDVLAMVFASLMGASQHQYETAREASALRGVAPTFDGALLEQVWGGPCEAMFEYLASRSPDLLARYITDEALSPGMRTVAAEAAGRIDDESTVERILLPVLGGAPAIVQEGCVYALERHLTPTVIARLRELADDPGAASGVRSAALDAVASAG